MVKGDDNFTPKDNHNLQKNRTEYYRNPCHKGYIDIRKRVRPGCNLEYEIRYGVRRIHRRYMMLIGIKNVVNRGLTGITYGMSYQHYTYRSLYTRTDIRAGGGVRLPYIIYGTLIFRTGYVGGNIEYSRRNIRTIGSFYTCNGRSM